MTMSPIKEKMIEIINSLPEDASEQALIEELLTKLMLEKSKEQFKTGAFVEHQLVKKRFGDE